MDLQIHGLDLTVILLTFVLVLGIGAYLYKKGVDGDDYMIAGRKLKWYAIGFHGAATYVGVGTLMGALGLAYSSGVSGALYPATLCLSFAILALLAKRLRVLNPVTTGDILAARFSQAARLPAAVAMLLAMTGSAAGQIKAFGALGNVLLGVDTTVIIIVFSAIALAYTLLGGMLAVAYTDVAQGIIMIGSVLLILFPIALFKADGIGNILDSVPESFTDISVAGGSTIAGYILVYGVLLSFYTTDGQRSVFAARDVRSAQKGSWFAFVLLGLFTLVAALIGMAGSILVPGIENSDEVFPTLAITLLPIGFAGLAIGGVFAAGMSTYDTSVITATAILVRDIIEPYSKKKVDTKTEKKLGLIMSVIMGVLITVLAITGSSIISVINLGFDAACCTVSAAMMAALFWPRGTSKGCIASMCAGFAIWLYMLLFVPSMFAAWVAVPVSLAVMVIVSLCTKAEDDEKLFAFYKDFNWVIGGAKWKSFFNEKVAK
jgi:SSS family solute:Na+ symporter